MGRLDLLRSCSVSARWVAVLAIGPLTGMTLCGCLVAGYSTGGGWFVWPGSFGILLVVLLVLFLLRRKR